MSMWMSGLFSAVSASHTHLSTRSYCLLLLLCNFIKTRNIDMVSAKRGSTSQGVPCYLVILVKSSSSPFRYVLRVKTQIFTHQQKNISIIHSTQSTWIWKVWILVWLWLWLRAYMIICKSLNFSEFILCIDYLFIYLLCLCSWFTMPYFSWLLWTATLMSSCGGSFRKAMWFHYCPYKQKAIPVFWLVKVKQQWSVFICACLKVRYQIYPCSVLFYVFFLSISIGTVPKFLT